MRYLAPIFIAFVILLAVVAPSVQAGKPQPYPPPDFEIQAYPAPPTPLAPTAMPSDLDQLYAQVPLAAPRDGVPFFWGRLKIGGTWAFFVTLKGVGYQGGLTDGVLCLSIAETPPPTRCDVLHFLGYSAQSDTNIFYTRMTYCDVTYFVSLVWLYNQGADYFDGGRTTQYLYRCIRVPFIPRG